MVYLSLCASEVLFVFAKMALAVVGRMDLGRVDLEVGVATGAHSHS